MVEDVEGVGLELELRVLGEEEEFGQGDVALLKPGEDDAADAGVAEGSGGRSAEGCRIEVLCHVVRQHEAVALRVHGAAEVLRATIAETAYGRVADDGVIRAGLHASDGGDLQASHSLTEQEVVIGQRGQLVSDGGDEGVAAIDAELTVVVVQVLPVLERCAVAGRIAERLGIGVTNGGVHAPAALGQVDLERVVVAVGVAAVLVDGAEAHVRVEVGAVGGGCGRGGGCRLIACRDCGDAWKVNVRLAEEVVAYVADIGGLHQEPHGQLLLDAKAVLVDVGVLEVGVDGGDGALEPGVIGGAAADVVQVGVVELDVLQKGLQVDLTEADVAFRAVVEDAEAAAHGGLSIGGVGEAEPWTESAVHGVEAARCAVGNERKGSGVDIQHAYGLVGGNTGTGANQAVERIAGARHDFAGGGDSDGVGWVVDCGTEVGIVVALGIERLNVLPAHAELDTERARGLPGVLREDLGLREAEVTDGIGAGLCV